MLRLVLFSLLTSALVPALYAQVPCSNPHSQDKNQAVFDYDDDPEWSLNTSVNPDATDHLVFETVHSLLQHWPNTRMRNGHNIVPGIIPNGTLLYHATNHKELPLGPEWTATDPEHAYFFCWEAYAQQPCWLLTLTSARPLKVVYFDGSSAAKLPYGSLDTQDLIAWGGTPPDGEWNEEQRIEDLCKWGKSFGLDGFVRMEMDFEIMLCDFSSGVSMVSLINIAPPWGGDPPIVSTFETFNAGSWHNHFPGETRVQLDLAKLVSFYDTKLAPSLVAVRAGQDRWDHRVRDISIEDSLTVKSRLEAVLTSTLSSGIDWRTLIQVMVDRFAGRLDLTRHLLNSPTTKPDEILDLASKTQTQLRIMLTPYLLVSAVPTDPSDRADLGWTKPTYKLCATTHTHLLASELDSMTDSEKLILQAVRGTTREICRVVTKMWAAGVYAGVDALLNTKKSPDIAEVSHVWSEWAEDLGRLMAWLDWSVWVRCNPACGPEELCYLPTWPMGFPNAPGNEKSPSLQRVAMGRRAEQALSRNINPGSNEWIRPRPKCIQSVDPYDF